MKKLLITCCTLLILITGQAFAGEQHQSVSININADDNNGVVVSTDVDGDSQVFDFTNEELKDFALLEERLSTLDDKTRDAVMKSLTKLAQHVSHGAVHKKKMIIVNGDQEQVMQWHGKGEGGQENVYAFAFSSDDNDVKFEKHIEFHADHSSELFPVIKRLIEKANLDAEQVAALRNLLDEK